MERSPREEARPDREMIAALQRGGLIADAAGASFERLTGGVSSDIWKVESEGRLFCVKRALPKLRVQKEWFAPVERNRFEVAWLKIAGRVSPGAAPRVLFSDEEAMLCAMEYLDPAQHPLWKAELRDGRARPADAAELGRRLVAIHAATAGDAAVAALFPRIDIFQAIRLEPYFEATAAAHPDLREPLYALSRGAAARRIALIHGDVSPKNILIGPNGPVILDAECACICDPAFDLAFCLNHFLLKCLWTPVAQEGFAACFKAMVAAYLSGVDWEPPDALERRAARLLPGLFLARIDGKSPVEYVTEEADRDRVRRCARPLVLNPPQRLEAILAGWRLELKA